ncbi:hypothetical protein [Dankookia sp. GCM10030260]|uniref:hypothetical protein n=1 Tax=Dankookia sp. GCM10030260 TaxID=3273390 RepID=UPI0036D218EB
MHRHSPDGQPIRPSSDERIGGLTAIATLTAHRSTALERCYVVAASDAIMRRRKPYRQKGSASGMHFGDEAERRRKAKIHARHVIEVERRRRVRRWRFYLLPIVPMLIIGVALVVISQLSPAPIPNLTQLIYFLTAQKRTQQAITTFLVGTQATAPC